jgi:apolipoprotein N-acyltransferase
LARSKKPSRADAPEVPTETAPLAATPAVSDSPRGSRGRLLAAYGLAALGGALNFVGFAGFDVWPLAFVAFVPLWGALDLARARGTRRERVLHMLGVSTLYGFVMAWGGYYWLMHVLNVFSGFGPWLCALFASLLNLFTGGSYVVASWLWCRARDRGWNPTLASVASLLACELLYPLLFPFYYGASFHQLPLLLQVADLGGPLLLTALAVVVSGALYELAHALVTRARPLPWKAPAAAAAYVVFALAYGAYRIHAVDAAVAAAPKLVVGLVQANMGLREKRENPLEGQVRHIDQSLELEAHAHPDLLVWPESAFTYFIPERVRNVKDYVLGDVATPVLFGGLSRRQVEGVERRFNTAFITDAGGTIRGTYDKNYLLAFGEYLPFGETFPFLYDLSKHSGHFTPGHEVHSLPFREYSIAALICYEDVLPGFVRRAMEGDPNLLVNMTNDAWFGDTTEPWIHFALAKLRAVEHHRYLVRATNSGVSGVVDPVGRVVTHSEVFERASLHAEVAMLEGHSLYESLGDWPGWLSVALIAWMAWRPRGRSRA